MKRKHIWNESSKLFNPVFASESVRTASSVNVTTSYVTVSASTNTPTSVITISSVTTNVSVPKISMLEIAEKSSIIIPSTSVIAVSNDTPSVTVPMLPIIDTSRLKIASHSTTTIVHPFSCTTSYCKLASFGKSMKQSGASTLESAAIITPYTSTDTRQISVPTLQITDASTLEIGSYEWPSSWEKTQLALFEENMNRSSNSSEASYSARNSYQNESFSRNVTSPYGIPVKYPFCILSSASLGNSKESGNSCYHYNLESPLNKEVSISQSASYHSQTSNFLFPLNKGENDKYSSHQSFQSSTTKTSILPVVSLKSSIPPNTRTKFANQATYQKAASIVSDEPISTLTLYTPDPSEVETASSLPSTSIAQPYQWYDVIPYWKLTSQNSSPIISLKSSVPPNTRTKLANQATYQKAASIVSDEPISALTLHTPNPSEVDAAASLPSTSIARSYSRTNLQPLWKLPSQNESPNEEINSCRTSTSVKDIYRIESVLRNVEPRYNFSIKYPYCILSAASLGDFKDGSIISCSENEIE